MADTEDGFMPPQHGPDASMRSSTDRIGVVGIVGVGLMGGSIGLALKAAGVSTHIVGIGRSVERLEAAQRLGAIDSYETDLARGVAQCDLIILCTTIGHIIDQIPITLSSAKPTAVVTDVGSTKSAIVETAGGDPRFIGGHPMCGSEKTGVDASRVELYAGAIWAVTPTNTTSQTAVDTLLSLISATGAVPYTVDPETHDTMVAVTSHLPHVMASALMRQAADLRGRISDLPRLAAGSFADMTRVAASSPSLWRDVCVSNRRAVLEAIEGYRRELDVLEAAVKRSDAAAIESFFTSGESAKREWPPKR